ncbi:HAD-IA family hydrolase, partial [Actinomadura sp. NPDC049753]|uniref:HAD-IA family hydrolase n=1 Tax=Actinomadura sp. NPDC049753 TaxID=3154739 RepID=UPI003431C119
RNWVRATAPNWSSSPTGRAWSPPTRDRGRPRHRKPRPGLVERAAERLGVAPSDCAVIGDIGGDIEAAAAAGARGILVPTGRTLRTEIAQAPETAPTLDAAVDLVLGGRRRR